MDKISEILYSVKERISNPLIFSFLVSWLVYNWKIPVALIWFDEKQISANGCKSIFDFIEDEWKRNGFFWTPLGIALIYTFGFPIVKNLISATQTWMTKWGENLNLRLSKNGKIGIEKYLKLRNEYSEKIEELEAIIAKEGEIREYNKILFSEKASLDSNNFELQKKLEEMKIEFNKVSDFSFLDGQWKYYREVDFDEFFGSENKMTLKKILISDRKWYSINEKDIKSDEEFGIDDFVYNKNDNQIIFIKRRLNLNESEKINYCSTHFINILNLKNGNPNLLTGFENGVRVEYKRMPK